MRVASLASLLSYGQACGFRDGAGRTFDLAWILGGDGHRQDDATGGYVDRLVDVLEFVEGLVCSFGRDRDLIHRLVCVGQREVRGLYGEACGNVHQGEDVALQLDDCGIGKLAAGGDGVQANLPDLHCDVVKRLSQALHLVVRESCGRRRNRGWCLHDLFDLDSMSGSALRIDRIMGPTCLSISTMLTFFAASCFSLAWSAAMLSMTLL